MLPAWLTAAGGYGHDAGRGGRGFRLGALSHGRFPPTERRLRASGAHLHPVRSASEATSAALGSSVSTTLRMASASTLSVTICSGPQAGLGRNSDRAMSPVANGADSDSAGRDARRTSLLRDSSTPAS